MPNFDDLWNCDQPAEIEAKFKTVLAQLQSLAQ